MLVSYMFILKRVGDTPQHIVVLKPFGILFSMFPLRCYYKIMKCYETSISFQVQPSFQSSSKHFYSPRHSFVSLICLVCPPYCANVVRIKQSS